MLIRQPSINCIDRIKYERLQSCLLFYFQKNVWIVRKWPNDLMKKRLDRLFWNGHTEYVEMIEKHAQTHTNMKQFFGIKYTHTLLEFSRCIHTSCKHSACTHTAWSNIPLKWKSKCLKLSDMCLSLCRTQLECSFSHRDASVRLSDIILHITILAAYLVKIVFNDAYQSDMWQMKCQNHRPWITVNESNFPKCAISNIQISIWSSQIGFILCNRMLLEPKMFVRFHKFQGRFDEIGKWATFTTFIRVVVERSKVQRSLCNCSSLFQLSPK